MKQLLIILAVVFAIIGYFILRWQRISDTPTNKSANANSAIPQLTLSGLQNARYRTRECGVITLSNGKFEGTQSSSSSGLPCRNVMLDKMALGDINSDGIDDAITFLGTDLGGSGFFVSLAAVINRNGSPYNIATLPLEDRIKIDAVRIDAGIIRLNATIHSAAAPMCCPDSAIQWQFKLVADSLVHLSHS